MTNSQEKFSFGIAIWYAILVFYVNLWCVVKCKFISSYWMDRI